MAADADRTLFDGIVDAVGDDNGADEATIQARFEEFHRANPHVYALFVRFATEAIRSGRENYGAKAIFERVRWHVAIETQGDDFRLNNNYTSRYVRMFEREHPQHQGFFRTRELRAQ